MRRQGFTLVEMMMGVFILGGALMAFLQALMGCMSLNLKNEQLTIAVNDAQYVLEQMKELDFSTCIDLDFPSTCFTFPVFTHLNSQTIEHTNVSLETGLLRQVTVKVRWLDKQKWREVSLATYFSP